MIHIEFSNKIRIYFIVNNIYYSIVTGNIYYHNFQLLKYTDDLILK
jgi:hypothetical protein